jgi:hypothetical protein
MHAKHMRSTNALYRISNKLRDVTICKFDGYLAKARLVIKILPNLNEYMSCVLLLRVQAQKASCLVLLDENLNFNCFDNNFATLMTIED